MLSNLNEKYLLKFISSANTYNDAGGVSLLELLNSFGIKLSFNEENPVHDIIDKLEHCEICYE